MTAGKPNGGAGGRAAAYACPLSARKRGAKARPESTTGPCARQQKAQRRTRRSKKGQTPLDHINPRSAMDSTSDPATIT